MFHLNFKKRVAVKWLENKLDLNLDLTLNFWSDLRNIETLTGFSRFLTTCRECIARTERNTEATEPKHIFCSIVAINSIDSITPGIGIGIGFVFWLFFSLGDAPS